jgi:hypothetical protein
MLRKYLDMKLGVVLFAVWLTLSGLLPLLDVRVSESGTWLALLAVAAGALILLGVSRQGWTQETGMLLLGVWLLAAGLIEVVDLSFSHRDTLFNVLAVAAGVLVLPALRGEDTSENLGWVAAGAWLIAWGVIPLLDLRFANRETLLNVLAVAAGALILLGR